jgi:glycerol-3-phosphate O-acyltransferase
LKHHNSHKKSSLTPFSIFDLEKKQTVFEERLENKCNCSDPIIVVGKQGHVAIYYRKNYKHIIVHYRILPYQGETQI